MLYHSMGNRPSHQEPPVKYFMEVLKRPCHKIRDLPPSLPQYWTSGIEAVTLKGTRNTRANVRAETYLRPKVTVFSPTLGFMDEGP